MEKLKRILEWIEKNINGKISIFFLMVMVVIISAQVFTRFVLNFSISWSEELARFLMIWMVFLAGCIALQKGALVGINFTVEKLPKKIQAYVGMINDSLMIFFLLVMTIKKKIMRESLIIPT